MKRPPVLWLWMTALVLVSLACGISGVNSVQPESVGDTATTALQKLDAAVVLESSSTVEENAAATALPTAPPPNKGNPVLEGKPNPTASPSGSAAVLNPLTGLPAANADALSLPPALVSVTNWPPMARPQAGLSFSPITFELYIGEGMSRFLAIFYGDYPSASSEGIGTELLQSDDAEIGPVRSGRLPYENLRSLYNGFLVMASAYKGVAANLSQHSSIFGSEGDDINSAMIPVTKLEDIARANQKKLEPSALSGMMFGKEVPSGGSAADQFWFIYNAVDQIVWKYDPASGSYLRYQDNADGKTFIRASDRLNGADLTLENVVVLFASHRACTEVAFDVDLKYIDRSPALLFRDGWVFQIYWTTRNEDYEKTTGKLRPIRFVDENGDPFPLKPGQTWVHLVPLGTPYWEAPNVEAVSLSETVWVSQNPQALLYNLLNKEEPGSGNWVTRYYASLIPYDKAVCEQLRK